MLAALIPDTHLPEPERATARSAAYLATLLEHYQLRYEATLGLLPLAVDRAASLQAALDRLHPFDEQDAVHRLRRERDMTVEWKLIAARDAAFTVFHFDQALKAFLSHVRRCPGWLAQLDEDRLNRAEPALHGFFGDSRAIEGLRNAIGHEAELVKSAGVADANMVKMDGGSVGAIATISVDGVRLKKAKMPKAAKPHSRATLHESALSRPGLDALNETIEHLAAALGPAWRRLRLTALQDAARERDLPVPEWLPDGP